MRKYRKIVNSRGQVVIPVELREQFGLKAGTSVTWNVEPGRLILTPSTECHLDEIMGFLKPAPGSPSAFEESFAERERERKREKQ